MSDAATMVATALVLLSPLVWMRLGLQRVPPLGPRERHLRRFAALAHRLAALCLCAAFALPVGPAAAWLATPWLLTAIALAISGALRLAVRRDLATFAEAAALAYPAIGAAWAVAARADYAPLDFAPAIVLLTAAHFHHAGFVLPLAAVLVLRCATGVAARTATVGVVAGMPLTAAGITTSQLGGPPWVERTGALLTVAFAALLGVLLLVRAMAADAPLRRRIALSTAGAALCASMALAAAYALRRELGVAWFDASLDGMVFSHGALNGLLFAGGVLLAEPAHPRRR